ncbi:MAG TPA: AarF/UbiB family protein [Methyloceanibacter sp.]|jgi:ubiquinone biosynthesis protein|nr:AarF/UbiB family protein [Methyloceanibacter sp.]
MRALLRLFRIVFAMARLGATSVLARLHLLPSRQTSSERLLVALTGLGTTFIKFGQALSMRQDIIPEDYLLALQSLQEDVAPFPAELAKKEIESALGAPVDQLFARFDDEPIASASIAQVHTAELLDGRQVVIKVRRVGIEKQIELDMRALKMAVRLVTGVAPHLNRYKPSRIVDEIWTNLRKEIDFRLEARNIKRFASAFANSSTIHVPGVVENLVSKTVIVQERSGGRRISDPAIRPEGPQLAQNLVDAYLYQIFVLGFFHGDPHPGNLFITTDGKICFHDFGLVGLLDQTTRRRLAAFISAFIRQDADWLLDAAIDLGILGGEIDRSEFRKGIAEILADYAALPLKEWSLSDAFLRVARLGQGQNMFIPHDLLVLIRAMNNAEHAVRTLDPDFPLLESLQVKGPEMLKLALQQADWKGGLDRLKLDTLIATQDLPIVLASWIRRMNREGEGLGLNFRLRGLESLEAHIDRSSNRVALALVTLGLFIAGSLLMQHSVGPRLYDIPIVAAFVFALALWFTFRLALGIARSGKL